MYIYIYIAIATHFESSNCLLLEFDGSSWVKLLAYMNSEIIYIALRLSEGTVMLTTYCTSSTARMQHDLFDLFVHDHIFAGVFSSVVSLF